jgi:isoleucyl-tRNA synthetase
VTSESGLSVALDLDVSPELARAGLARDVVRVIQDARKAAGLDVTDRIDLWWSSARAETARALREHAETVASEVLAVTFAEGTPPATAAAAAAGPQTADDLGLTFTLHRALCA